MAPTLVETTPPPETITGRPNVGEDVKPDSYHEKDSGTDDEILPKESLKFTEGNDTAQEADKDVPIMNRRPSDLDIAYHRLSRDDEKYDEKHVDDDVEMGPGQFVNNSQWLSRRTHDIILLILLISMLTWPWIFWGAVRASKGVQMNNRTAQLVRDHPHTTTFIVTFIGNLITITIDILFSLSVIRLAQEWFGKKRREESKVTVFHVSMLSGVRNQRWPWHMGDLRMLFSKSRRWLPLVLLATCISAFTLVPPSATSLLTPVPYNETASLTGTELDFSSTAPDCLAWFKANDLSNNCDWKFFKNVSYTTCLGENQMVDVLESGRGSILSLLSNNTESLTLSQLGSTDGIRFLGPIGGVLPMGPDGVPSFDTTSQGSPFSSEEIKAGMIAYNYTLEQQGIASGVSCSYDSRSPIKASDVPGERTILAFQYNASCSDLGQLPVLTDVKTFVWVNGNHTLLYWACQSPPVQDRLPTYYIYLRGRGKGAYTSSFGNMTCTVAPIQPAVYPLTYFSESRIFKLGSSIDSGSTLLPRMIEHALVGLGGTIQQSQNWGANLVAESIITFAVKSFGITKPYERQDRYLQLTESMLKGILEYQATYIRLVYSTKADQAPDSCRRKFGGEASFTVLGWNSTTTQIGLILPMTLITFTAIIIVVMAMVTAVNDNEYNAGDLLAARPLLSAAIEHAPPPEDGGEGGEEEGQELDSLEDVVTFGQVDATHQATERDNQQELPWFEMFKECLGLK